MEKTAVCVFEILEKIWNVAECSLIDMKIEFGIDNNGKTLCDNCNQSQGDLEIKVQF